MPQQQQATAQSQPQQQEQPPGPPAFALPPRPPTPTTRPALEDAAARFEALTPRLPPPPSRHAACPGVYRRTGSGSEGGAAAPPACGAPLAPCVSRVGPPGPDGRPGRLIQAWRCSKGGAGACGFRETPLPRSPAPRLALVLDTGEDPATSTSGGGAFFAQAAPGAREAVDWCGGVGALLRLAGAPPGGAPDPATGRVRFPLHLYPRVLAACLAVRVAREPLLGRAGAVPAGVLAAWRAPAAGGAPPAATLAGPPPPVEALVRAGVPAPLAAALLPFQRAGVAYALARGGRALIGDEVGVGKTVQALAIAAAYRAEWPLLIICPASLRLVWADAFEVWCGAGAARPRSLVVIEGRTDAPPPPGTPAGDAVSVVITSYDMLARLACGVCTRDRERERGGGGGGRRGAPGRPPPPPAAAEKKKNNCPGPALCLAARGWAVVVVDEAHTLRSSGLRPPDARHTEAAAAVLARARRRSSSAALPPWAARLTSSARFRPSPRPSCRPTGPRLPGDTAVRAWWPGVAAPCARTCPA